MVERDERLFSKSFGQHNVILFDENRSAILRTMFDDHRMLSVDREEDDFPFAFRSHRNGVLIGRVEHRVSGRRDDIDDDSLDLRQFVERFDVAQAEVISLADVRHDGHIATIEAEPRAQDSAASSLEHSHFDFWVHQHVASTQRPAAIAVVDAAVVDVDAVGTSMSNGRSGPLEDVSREPGRRRLSVDTCNRHDRNATVFTFGKQRADDRFTDGPRLSIRRSKVHSQSGSRIDFHDRSRARFARLSNIDCHHVDTGDVESDHSCRFNASRDPIRMHLVGDIHRSPASAEVRVAANEHSLSGRRDGIGGEALLFEYDECGVVDVDFAEHRAVVLAAPRILIDHVDQLLNRVQPIADDICRLASRGGDQLAADH